MSQLYVSINTGQQFALNVVAFQSPIFASFNGAQTKTQYQYFPYKVNMPELELDVQFASESDYETFQAYVRNSQVQALAMTNGSPQVALYWPQRSIYNWTGFIKGFKAGGRRANYAPRAKFVVDIASGLVSSLAQTANLAATFSSATGIGLTQASNNTTDNMISPPAQNLFGTIAQGGLSNIFSSFGSGFGSSIGSFLGLP